MPNAHGGSAAAQQKAAAPSSIAGIVRAAIEKLRIKLLDLTNRNRLLNFRFSETSRKLVRVVDVLPDQLFERLSDETVAKKLFFAPLPEPDERDVVESTGSFQRALDVAHHTDDSYLAAMQAADQGKLDEEGVRQAEEDLRASVRKQFGRASSDSSSKAKLNIADWARQHGIDPSYDLPEPNKRTSSGKAESLLQTLLLPDALERKLSGVREAAILAEQELGLSTLYTAFGFLEWYESPESDEPRFAPLVLLPVKIDRELKQGKYRYFVEGGDGEAAVNLTLRERLRHDFQLELPEFEEEETPESYFFRVAALLTNNIKRWKVRRFVVIGHFSFARLAMFEDLAPSRWAGGLEENELLNALLMGSEPGDTLTASEYELDNEEVERTVPILVTDADSSQFSSLLDAMSGRSFALKGPPGTGKSQTITNLIALALAKGKRVLFVAEKMAALEVVAKRLRDAKLGSFLLELHSTKVQKKKVLQSFEERLNLQVPKPDQGVNRTLDTLRKVRAELTRYAALMNTEVGKTGTTLHGIYWLEQRSRRELGEEAYNEARRLSEPDASEISDHAFAARLETLSDFAESWRRCVDDAGGMISGHALASFDCSTVSPVDHPALLDDIRTWAELTEKFEALRVSLGNTLRCHWPDTLSALRALCEKLVRLEGAKPAIDSNLLSLASRKESFVALEEVAECVQQILKREKDLLLHFDNVPLMTQNLARLREAAEVASEASARLAISDQVRPSVLAAHLDEEHKKATRIIESLQIIGRVSAAADATGLLTLTDFDSVVDLIGLLHQSSESAIRARRESLFGQEANECLSAAAQTAARLTKERQRLSQLFDLTKLEPSSVLKEHATALRDTHPLLAAFTRRCRRARRYYSYIAIGKKAARAEMVASFFELASLVRAIGDLTSDERVKSIVGASFKGLGTDFQSLLGANELSSKARRRFSSLNAKQQGYQRLLLLGDAQFLIDVREALKPEDLQLLREWISATGVSPEQDIVAVVNGRHNLARRGMAAAATLVAIALRLPLTVQEIRAKLDSAHGLLGLRKALGSSPVAKQARLSGESLSPADTDRLCQALAVAKEVLALGLPHDMTAIILSSNYGVAVSGLKKGAGLIARANERYDEFPTQLHTRYGIRVFGHNDGSQNPEPSLTAIGSRLRAASSVSESVVSSWTSYCRLQKRARSEQLAFIVDSVNAGRIAGELAPKVYAFVHFRSLIRSTHESTSALATWTGEHLGSLRKRLQSLDAEYLDRAQQWLRSTLAQVEIPRGNAKGPKKEWTDRALIENEIPKQKRVLSIRKLLERAMGAALALKPCFMMSPASVAQFMPQKKGAFDLVVIDEASQMRPEEAVGCLARGAQVVVVGDPMQLPPTSFFDSVDADDGMGDEEQFDVDAESVLDQALARLRPHRELRWHYRSKHHSLIAFSNREFYQNNLIVFPSPAEESAQLGIEYVYVEKGIYHASVNPAEADTVVNKVAQLMIARPKDSIGVVAINQPQQQLLSEIFDRRFAEDPSLEEYRLEHAESLEPFFIKNLENVQGDERDVIVISTVYGPSQPGGPVFQRFGPINSRMGHRRLNVLFTRAKKRVVLVSSLRSEDVQVNPGSSPGLSAFKGYLEFARSGRLDSGGTAGADAFESPFEAEVAYVLRQAGYKVASQVGVAGYFLDLAVRHPQNPDHFVLGVECDGATYHSARCARDRDKLRQQILESLGWNIFRIWSTDWFSDRPREVEKLKSHLERLLRARGPKGH